MEFVKVRHEDGREADITPAEVAFYRSIGFEPADGQTVRGGKQPAAASQPLAAANGTDQRLDLVLDELRGLRADLAGIRTALTPVELEPQDGEPIELREPATDAPVEPADPNATADSAKPDKAKAKS